MSQTSDSLPKLYFQFLLCLVIFLLCGKDGMPGLQTPTLCAVAETRNMPSCKSEAIVCRYLFPLSFQCTHLDLHQKSGKLTMKFHWLYALPHIFFKTEMAGFFLLAATLQYAIQCFLWALKHPKKN